MTAPMRGAEAARIAGGRVAAGARDQVADWVVGTIAAAGGEVTGLRVRLEPAAGGLTVGQVNLVCFDRALRVQAADAGGSGIEQTIMTAYHG